MFITNQKVLQKKLLTCPNVLTPDRIPEFFIPPKFSTFPNSISEKGSSSDRCLLPGKSYHRTVNHKTLVRSANQHIIQIENVDQDSTCNPEGESEHRLHNTYSVSHLSSPRDFTFLPESPHTRRRESLFHAKCPSIQTSEIDGKESLSDVISIESQSPQSLRLSSPDLRSAWLTADTYSLGHMDSDTTSSAESSPFSSPLLTRSLAGTLVCQAYSRQRLFCRTLHIRAISRTSSLSTDEASSTDNSPSVPRRDKDATLVSPSRTLLAPPPVFPLDFICCHERLTKENTVTLNKGGKLRISAEYLMENCRLRIRIISAENLYQSSFDSKNISCCIRIHIQPGKVQKQRSTVIKNSRNPIFNEDFFFEGISEEDLTTKTVKIKVINKGSSMRRDFALGDTELKLCSILPP
ncbi:C2 calcium-dependent domain-containing protein 4D [Protopterus annectens]|uniref:C2 calcium-dependent domain-containing protein 4D n=1 Tax=Protopterus annectens TaxID=7888 RepID=UPI001CFC11BA|nr:C2 calcium-dependent domain-containing protein 4D [Protopterus annectens]